MTPRVKPPHTLVSVLHWYWYCRATSVVWSCKSHPLVGKKYVAISILQFEFCISPAKKSMYNFVEAMPKQKISSLRRFFPIKSVTKSSTARFSNENLIEKIKIFIQDFVPIRTALRSQELFPKKYSWFYMQRMCTLLG